MKMSERMKALLIFLILAGLFCFSTFYRVMNAVIATDLMREFDLDAERLGMLGSAFFYTFAFFQMPIGILLDRVGPRSVMPAFCLIGSVGVFIYAWAGGFYTACLGMALIGTGMASVLMGSLRVFLDRYPAERFPTLCGIMISIGALGSISATSPLAYLNSSIGWRLTLICCGLVTAALAILLYCILGGKSAGEQERAAGPSSPKEETGMVGTAKLVLCTLSFWQIGLLAFLRYGTCIALQGIWLGPYLMVVKRFSPIAAGNILMMISLGLIAGSPIAGYLAEKVFKNTKTIILLGVSCYTLCILPLTGIWDFESAAIHSALFLGLGFFSSFGVLLYSNVKELFPPRISSTVIAGVNFFVMAGGAVFMQILGVIIAAYAGADRVHPLEAYQTAFRACFWAMVGGLVFYAFSGNRKHEDAVSERRTAQ